MDLVPVVSVTKTNKLSDRELEVLQLTANGECAKGVARSLGLAEATVKVHRKAIIRKLNAKNSTHAAVIALKRGILS